MNVVKRTRTLIRSASIRTPICSSSLRNVILLPYTTSTSTSSKVHPLADSETQKSSEDVSPIQRDCAASNANFEFRALAEALKSSKDVSSIHRTCSALATKLKDTPDVLSQPISDDDSRLLPILQKLAVSARPEDMLRIEEILHDFYPILGMKPARGIYTSILLGLANGGHGQQVLNFLLKMPQLPGHFTPTIEQLHAVLVVCSEYSDFQLLKDLVMNIRRMGQCPTHETFSILFRWCWRIARREHNIPTVQVLTWLIHESARQGLTFDPIIAKMLYRSFADIGRISDANEISSLYVSVSSKVDETPDVGDASSLRNGNPPHSDRRGFLRRSRAYTDILQLERTYSFKSTTVHWSIVLNNCLRSGYIMEAFEVYDQSKMAGITPDAALISPLLRHLALSDTKDPSDESINRALAIYRDLADAVPPSMHHHPSKVNLNVHSAGPDIDIYNTLLRMLLASRSETDYLSVADSLLKEMEDRHLPTNSGPITAVKIIIGMRRAKTNAAALDFYREHRSCLDDRGFTAVLQAYCRLSFRGDLQVPLITQYFSMVNDMRAQKVPITPKVYTIILHQIGIMTRNLRNDYQVLERLVATIRRVHDFLSLDASFTPDAPLWNQLMSTYARLGCFGDACRVWEMMYLTGRYDQISVSIILDACGYAGDLQFAYSVRKKLSKAGFVFDMRNWNTWLEFLCRLGKFDEAIQVVCSEMGNDGMMPDVGSVTIIVKFARRAARSQELLSRLQNVLPADLWQRLPAEIRNS